MVNSILDGSVALWMWLKDNDIPNWIAVAFTGIFWPITLYLWQRRKINSVPGLEVHFSDGSMNIESKHFSAIDIQFTNHTGAVVYISGARIRSCTKMFPVPPEAARDVAQGSYHLKFLNGENGYSEREVTLQTNTSAKTSLATTPQLKAVFYTHSTTLARRLFRCQKYFVLEYTAMVGTSRYAVATVY